ncbi:MAG: DNA-processing protein DprA [Bacteroidota bacterium]
MSEAVIFARTLLRLDGVGRVTAGRLLRHFGRYSELVQYPREQVLTRLKGVPRAAALVKQLFDRDAMEPHLQAAREDLAHLSAKRVALLTQREAAWPRGLNDLPASQRPLIMYAYGNVVCLTQPRVAIFGAPGLSVEAFEGAQRLARRILQGGGVVITGMAHGFDVALQKLAHAGPARYPGAVVADMGMAVLPKPMRPHVTAAVRAAGVFLSPFDMDHGPFAYDEKESALVRAALADAVVFADPQPDTPAARALAWAQEAERPVFVVGPPAPHLAERIHRVTTSTDEDWVLEAAGLRPRSGEDG